MFGFRLKVKEWIVDFGKGVGVQVIGLTTRGLYIGC